MRNYTTQMDAARKGIVTPEIETVAKKENMDVDKLMKLVAEGKVAICANKNHKCLSAEGVGSMLRTKINVNLGVSRDCKDYDIEMQKVMSAVDLGAEAIMDLSSHGNTQPFRQKLTSECPVMILGILLAGLYVFATTEFQTRQEIAMAVFTAVVQGILVAGLSTYVDQLLGQRHKSCEKEEKEE